MASVFAHVPPSCFYLVSLFSPEKGQTLLLRIWINLRLTLLFLRQPLASYKGLHFAIEKGEQFCLDEVCNYVQEDALML